MTLIGLDCDLTLGSFVSSVAMVTYCWKQKLSKISPNDILWKSDHGRHDNSLLPFTSLGCDFSQQYHTPWGCEPCTCEGCVKINAWKWGKMWGQFEDMWGHWTSRTMTYFRSLMDKNSVKWLICKLQVH